MLNHGEDKFGTAQDARGLLQDHGFVPLVRLGMVEHWVREGRRCTLIYEGEVPGAVSLKGAQYVYFTGDSERPQVSLA